MSSSEVFGDARNEVSPSPEKIETVSSFVANSQEAQRNDDESKDGKDAKEGKESKEKKDNALQNLKTAVMVSGVIVALAGAAFAITKKLREK